jgi:hypothetical protein
LLLDPLERDALARCGPGESGLSEVARTVVARKLRGEVAPEIDAIALAQRAAGEPHTWPRLWVAAAPALDAGAALRKLESWLADAPEIERRCGVASASAPDGTRVLAVLIVDALADLMALPTRARGGQWLRVQARMRVPARGAQVIVVGPGGTPRRLPTAFDGSRVRAVFAPDRAGEHNIQVVADIEGGPRPVLEASVFVDVDPPTREAVRAAPGEGAADATTLDGDDDAALLARMLDAARAGAGLAPLPRDPRLDSVARAHAVRMAREHHLAHDVGDGDPLARVRQAGLDPADLAENVAHARTVALAHRAQWWSPSHRANLLRSAGNRLGVAVARDERGDAWVVELFAAGGGR